MKGKVFVPRWLMTTVFSLLVILVSAHQVTPLKAEERSNSDEISAPAEVADSVRQATSLSEAFRHATEIVRPSVVSIRADQQPYFGMLSAKPVLYDSWKHYLNYAFGQVDSRRPAHNTMAGPQPLPQHSANGVIVGREGYVLTSCDVVAGANQFIVKTHANIEYPAKVARKDTKSGLAFLKIDAPNVPAARLANFDKTRIGDWVLAIGGNSGNPVSAGIISSIGNGAGNGNDQAASLHTDALISPANHGGPLVNLRGEVVGINIFKATRGGESREFGVAVPSHLAQRLLDSMLPDRAIASRPPSSNRSWSKDVMELINQAGSSKRSVGAGIAHSEWRDRVRELASRFKTLVTEFSQSQESHGARSVDQTDGRQSRVDIKFSPEFSENGSSGYSDSKYSESKN